MSDSFRILEDPLDPRHVVSAVRDPACGAVTTFLGTVRAQSDGKRVLRLEYEVQEAMALKMLARLAEELKGRHAVRNVAIDHRRGAVEVGDFSVAIGISAPRRRDALAACAEAIERLKKDVPIWKCEFFDDGTHRWVEGS